MIGNEKCMVVNVNRMAWNEKTQTGIDFTKFRDGTLEEINLKKC